MLEQQTGLLGSTEVPRILNWTGSRTKLIWWKRLLCEDLPAHAFKSLHRWMRHAVKELHSHNVQMCKPLIKKKKGKILSLWQILPWTKARLLICLIQISTYLSSVTDPLFSFLTPSNSRRDWTFSRLCSSITSYLFCLVLFSWGWNWHLNIDCNAETGFTVTPSTL